MSVEFGSPKAAEIVHADKRVAEALSILSEATRDAHNKDTIRGLQRVVMECVDDLAAWLRYSSVIMPVRPEDWETIRGWN